MDINSFLEEVKRLPDLAKLLQGLVESTTGAIVLSIYLLIYVFNKLPQLAVIQSWNKKKEERTKALEAYRADKDADASVKAIIKDQRDARHFELVTGIHAEEKWRNGLVDLHARSNATWLEMKRAWRYMAFDPTGALQIRKFTGWDKVEAWYNSAMAVFLLISATLAFILAASSAHVRMVPTQATDMAPVKTTGAASVPQAGGTAPAQATGKVAPVQTTGMASALQANGTAAPAGKAGTVTFIQKPVMTVLLSILFSFALFGSGIWAAAQNLPMKAAKKIQREADAAKASAVAAADAAATNAAAAARPADVPVGTGGGASTADGSAHISSAPLITNS